jgi:hypothetical protein
MFPIELTDFATTNFHSPKNNISTPNRRFTYTSASNRSNLISNVNLRN